MPVSELDFDIDKKDLVDDRAENQRMGYGSTDLADANDRNLRYRRDHNRA